MAVRLNKVLNHLEEWLIALLIAGATLLIFASVIHRYGSSQSINLSKWAASHGFTLIAVYLASIYTYLQAFDVSWMQELCIYMFVWMAKFGAAYGVRTGVHVGVDVVTNSIAPTSRYWVVIFGLVCGALFTFAIGTLGVTFVIKSREDGAVSDNIEWLPMWIVYLAIPLGSYLMCFRFVQVIVAFARTGDLPHTDESHVDGLDEVVPAKIGGAQPAAVAGGAL